MVKKAAAPVVKPLAKSQILNSLTESSGMAKKDVQAVLDGLSALIDQETATSASKGPGHIQMRIQVEFRDASEAEYFSDVYNEYGFRSKADFFNNALAMMDWMARSIAGGYRIVAEDPESENKIEFVTPVTQYLTAKHARERARKVEQAELV